MLHRFAVLAIFAVATASAGNSPRVFTMCIPEKYSKECVKMMEESASKGFPISCISGRDRYDCIERVGRKEADIVAVDPEDMYLAAKNKLAEKAGYSIVEQVRTKEEPDAIYRYEAVAVIHKDLDINNVQGLKGLKSCHTGVGRNVGYKIPITKLTAMGVLTDINNPEYSARENELRALSTLFDKGCLVGTWSPDPTINQRLKETYSNMCALCEKPNVCDYPDIYSGYEGALRCLAHNGGDVAWTKVIYVKRFFGLPVGVTPAMSTSENPADFRYFCPDGSKVPIDADTKPCTWAARPWQGYMTNGADANNAEAIQRELTQLGQLGENEKADWWEDLLLLNEKTLAVAAPPVSPDEHLQSAKYMDVIERNSGAPERNARWCVWDENALNKCRNLARAAFSRDARPRFDCILEKDETECLKAVRDNGADITVIDGGSVKRAINEYNIKPIIAETYGEGSTKLSERPALAVVKSGSSINGLGDLKDKLSCHSGYVGDFAGYNAPARILKLNGLINEPSEINTFFSKSCAPGAPLNSKSCQLCVGNIKTDDDQAKEATKCRPTNAEYYNGGKGALRCLKDGKGDVAFLPLTALQQLDNEKDAAGKLEDYILLCPNGGQAPINEWERCNLGLEPPRIIVSSAGKGPNALEELKHGILAASTLYSKNPDLLRLFGAWGDKPNVLFKDDVKELMSIDNTWDKWNPWADIQQDYGTH
ncbi:Transferrin [Trachymyrmex zeteki]|uniref:Transferrin n=1 Tax=Mycetomoellerius zeteki TaxID=64791 RepID=A0A151WU63_9HYME|nr:PREDICTED: transferrin [Trachymyrmex zeteki]KYQ51459.1 Transferrin [Trachymyrmex zeteki]